MLNSSQYSIQNFNNFRQNYISKLINDKRWKSQKKINEKFINVINKKEALLSRLRMIEWSELIEMIQNPNFYDDLYEIIDKYELISINEIEEIIKEIQSLKTQKKFLEQNLISNIRFEPNNSIKKNQQRRMINEEIIDIEVKISAKEFEYKQKVSFNEKQLQKIISYYEYQIKELREMQAIENNDLVKKEQTESIGSINYYNKNFIKKYQELLIEWSNKTTIKSQNGEYVYSIDDSSCETIIVNAWKNDMLQGSCFFDPNILLNKASNKTGLNIISIIGENSFFIEFKKAATQIANWVLFQIRQIVK